MRDFERILVASSTGFIYIGNFFYDRQHRFGIWRLVAELCFSSLFPAVYWEFLKYSSNQITLVFSVLLLLTLFYCFYTKYQYCQLAPGPGEITRKKTNNLFFKKYSLVNYPNYWVLAPILRAKLSYRKLITCLQTAFWEARMEKMWTFAWRKRYSSLVRMQWWNTKPFNKLPSLKKRRKVKMAQSIQKLFVVILSIGSRIFIILWMYFLSCLSCW